jgi:quinol-cytochrome oxidoreductase complex cytochrome b subunit
LRNLHYWAAQALVIMAVVHMLRVIFTGAYAPPRRFNYLLGLSLLALSLFLDFTGYVLRWDEGIRWALVAGTNLIKAMPVVGPGLYILVMGGSQPGPAALTRFYTWHIFGLMLLLIGIGVWHLFRVRRDGGIAAPPPELRRDPARITRFELARREGLAAILATVALLLLSIFIPAPLAPAMTAVSSQVGDARAPWFFLWVQQLLRWGSAFWMGVFVPLAVLMFIALIPYLLPLPQPAELGEWFPRRARLAQAAGAALALALLVLTLLALRPVE